MDERPLKIAIVAGEASGDQQGAALLAALKQIIAPRAIEAWGLGGHALRREGVELLYDSSLFGSIGIVATLGQIPTMLRGLGDMRRSIAVRKPDVVVLIDAGGFNVPLARWVKERGICPVFYYFPPSSWRRSAKVPSDPRKSLASLTDRIVTPFPWSETNLKAIGADAHFVGHPLLDLARPKLPAPEFYERFGLDPRRQIVALMPGSRVMEIQYILPAMIGAAGEIARRIPSAQFALALAPNIPRSMVEEIVRREQKPGGRAVRLQLFMHQAGGKLAQIAQSTLTPVPQLATNEGLTLKARPDDDSGEAKDRAPHPAHAPLVICEDLTYDVIARSDLVIAKSGTSTLEAMILGKPMIIVYRGSPAMAVEWRIRKRRLNIQYVGMPNILAEEMLFPELLQDDATPEAIARLALDMLLQPERILALKERLADVSRATLGEPGAIRRAAELLYETATK
jgi:lipid-A-disaccharide synthase